LHSLSFVDMNRTLSRTALNTKHVWPVWLRTENCTEPQCLYKGVLYLTFMHIHLDAAAWNNCCPAPNYPHTSRKGSSNGEISVKTGTEYAKRSRDTDNPCAVYQYPPTSA